jgi:anthranilate phosphoribosyltransferase
MAKRIKFIPEKRGLRSFLHEAIYRINVGLDLTEEMAFNAFREVLLIENSEQRAIFMGILLNGGMAKKPTTEEVVGFIKAAFSLDNFNPQKLSRSNLNEKVIGLAGSGKKGIKTMNISSSAAIVASSLGVNVAKICSGSTSSSTGSADFIEMLGANISDNREMISILERTGLGFFKIENQIPKFNLRYGGRFYAPHVLSFGLAGMILPFIPDSLLYGLSHPNIELSARVFQRFGYKNAMVVTNTDDGVHFLDEFGVFGTTSIIGVRNGDLGKMASFATSDVLGLPKYTQDSIKPGKSKLDNIRLAVQVLGGKGEPAIEDIVSVNAGTLLYLAGKAGDLRQGYTACKRVIRKRYPIEKLKEFIKATGGDEKTINRYL